MGISYFHFGREISKKEKHYSGCAPAASEPLHAASSPPTRTPARSPTWPPPLAIFAASTAGRPVLGDAAVRVAARWLCYGGQNRNQPPDFLRSTARRPDGGCFSSAHKSTPAPHHARRQRLTVSSPHVFLADLDSEYGSV